MPASILWNKKPLPQNTLASLPLTAIRPKGWLLSRIQQEKPQGQLERLMHACALYDKDLMSASQDEINKRMVASGQPSNRQIRALLRYYAVSGDKNVPLYLLRYAKQLRAFILEGGKLPVGQAASVGDLLMMTLWLYNLTGQKGLLELCRMIKAQAPDWMSTFHIFPQTKPVTEAPAEDTDAYFRVHGPTIAASLKTPALQALFEGGLKNETAFDVGWEKLIRHHGSAHGVFAADPLLAGRNPSRGVDPSVIEELVYTLQIMLWAQGQARHGDLLETVLYGPLMHGRGTQAANQITADSECTMGCLSQCAASLWMATSAGGLAAIAYAPCEVRWRIGGQAIRLQVETNYPYEDTVHITVHTKAPTSFPLQLRIPAWATEAKVQVNGETSYECVPGTFLSIEHEWAQGDSILLHLPMEVVVHRGYHQSVSITRGPLLYALPVEDGTPWNMALLPEKGFTACVQEGIPIVRAQAAQAEAWHLSGDTAAAPPIAPPVSSKDVRTITLLPYGELSARISQFPAGRVQVLKGDTL